MKNKTVAAWLAFLGGPLGLHRFYLRGLGACWAGCFRSRRRSACMASSACACTAWTTAWSWVLIPLLGFTIAGCALTAIVYGLMTPEKWNARYNAGAAAEAPRRTHQLAHHRRCRAVPVLRQHVLMASIAFSFQRFFEHQIEEGRKISQ